MKKVLGIAAVALFVAGSSALACGGGGCCAKQGGSKQGCSKKTECSASKAKCGAQKETKKCGADCTKPCCAKTGAKSCPKQ